MQAFGIHNTEFEMVWAEGEETGASVASPADQCLIIRRNTIDDPGYVHHAYANYKLR